MNTETAAAVRAKAATFKVPAAHLAALVEVESNGQIFAKVDGELRPLILPEPHVFYRRLEGDERERAVKAGLAYAAQGAKPYPRTQKARWAQLDRMANINFDEAYQSTSYGVGQVMGYHWKALGYASLQDFLDTVFSGVDGQIDAMLRYCVENDLLDDVAAGRWLTVARGYNGKKYAASYAKKLKAAAERYGASIAVSDGLLRMGASGARVRELQALLVRAGFEVKVDGDFGPATRTALKAFQRSKKLKADGVYGPKTEAALSAFRQAAGEKPGAESITEIDEVKQGAGGVAGGAAIELAQQKIDETTMQLQAVDGFQPWLTYGLTALSIIAAGLALWGLWVGVRGWLKSRRTVEA
jgi:hypothetical protein